MRSRLNRPVRPPAGIGAAQAAAETLRNLAAAFWRATLTAVAAAVFGIGIVTATVLDTSAIERQYLTERDKGAYVFEARSGNTDGLDGARCSQFARVDGTLAAGAALSEETVALASAPGQAIRLVRATLGTAQVAWPGQADLARSSTVVGQDLAEKFGLAVGQEVALANGGTLTVDAIGAGEARIGGYSLAIVVAAVPRSGERSASCVIEARPGHQAAIRQALSGWFDPADKVVVFELFERSAGAEDPATRLRGRVSARIAAGLGAVALVGSCAGWWARRRDVSLYRMLGARSCDLLAMATTECLVVLVLPAMTGAGLAVFAMAPEGLVAAAVSRDLLRFLAFGALAPVAAVLLLGRVRPWDGVRGV
ncbi:MAG: hypothetical protein LBS27_01910 [Bifidobacteriaceae bacterium]|jgi:hypothetical protein|nr:hypothetical protein [Bifidobacteriaceae bacterium]